MESDESIKLENNTDETLVGRSEEGWKRGTILAKCTSNPSLSASSFVLGILFSLNAQAQNVSLSGSNGEIGGCSTVYVPSECATETRAAIGPVNAGTWTHTSGPRSGVLIGANLSNSNSGPLASGTASATAGGVANTGRVFVGFENNTSGSFGISGDGSRWTVAGGFTVGHYGNGSLSIADGGYLQNGNGFIGTFQGSSGEALVSGVSQSGSRSTWVNTGRLYLGGDIYSAASRPGGQGSLTVADGALVSVGGSLGNVSIGTSVGGVGVVNIAGVNLGSGYRSTLNAGGEIRLGDFGTGTLDIAEGALVKSGSTVIGGYTGIVELPADGGNTVFPTGAVGSASVHGTSGGYRATWENTGAFFVGNYNEGSLSIYDQGLVTSGLSLIGNRPGTVGHVEVSGSGSQWIVNNNLTAGSGGQGSLTITQGGYVEAQSVNIGLSSPDGSILVSDSGSHLNVIGSMLVAYTGNGTLTVANNGKVSAQFIDVAGYSGTGVINVGTGGVSGLIDTAVITGRRGDATLNFNHSDDIGFLPKLTGNLDVNQVNSGATTLTAVNDYAGMTTIDAGTLRAGLSGAFSSNSDHVVNAGGTLDLNGFDQTIASLQNSGIVTFAGVPGATLTLAGDYRGGGGTVLFNTVLGDDGSSTDRLVVSGDTSGNSSVKVANVSGSGAPTVEGIKIIDVAGTSAGTFSLLGDYVFEGEQAVVGGAYGYRLYQGGTSTPDDGDWYLRSQLKPVDSIGPDTPLYQPGVPTYEAYPQLLLGLNSVPTLQQRVGSRYWNNAGNHVVAEGTDEPAPNASPSKSGQFIEQNAVWGRMGGEHHRINPRASASSTDYSFDTFLMQAGVDGMLSESESGTLIGGVTVHYVHGKADTRSIYGNGDISTNGYGFGGTLTWYGENGFYIDGQTQATWYNSGLSSNLANTGLTGSNDGFGYSFSAETGKRIAIDENWSVTPQAQLSYSHVDFDSFDDVFGARVSLDRGESLKGRLGLSVERQTSWYNDDGLLNRANVYGISNLYYEFLDGTRVDVSGTEFTSRNEKLWGGIGLGGSYNWDNDKYSIYAEGSINTSLSAFADSYSYKGTVGFRVKW